MNRTLLTVVLAGLVSSAAFGEGAVAQAPGKLLALNDLDSRVATVAQTKAAAKLAFDTREQFEAVSAKLNEQLATQLQERMQRDLSVAMQ